MILAELKSYIAEHRGVSRRELAEHFRLSEDGVEAMLAVWLKKGVISRQEDTNAADKVMRVRYVVNLSNSLAVSVTM